MRYELILAAILTALAWTITTPTNADACMLRSVCNGEDCATIKSTCAELNSALKKRRKIAKSIAARKKRLSEESVVDSTIDMINGGEYQQAIAQLYATFGPKINSWALNATAFTEREHSIVLIVAIATLRGEGMYKRDATAGTVDAATQRANVRWAIIAVDGLAYVNYAEPRHVAEAWARDPATQDAAREKLWGLYKKSRLSSDAQFEVLARLLRDVGRDVDADTVLATSREKVQ